MVIKNKQYYQQGRNAQKKECPNYRKLRISNFSLYAVTSFSNVYEIQYEKYLQNIILLLRLRLVYLLVKR